jgi:hypothetical protein
MSLAYSSIDDAVLLTQENLVKRGAFVDLQTDVQDHVAVREMWKDRQKKFAGGLNWEWQLQISHNYSARAVGAFETDGSEVLDTMIKASVEPRHVNAHYIYDQHEPDFQRGGLSIVDLVNTRYVAMMVSFYEYLETVLWSKPADSTDEKTPYGLAYWIIKNATEGFNAENPTGFALGRGNVDSTVYTRWANWADDYDAVSKEDLIRKMRKGSRMVNFRSPITHSTPELGAMKNGIYTNDAVVGLMEEVVESQNMNLGNDLASRDGQTLFKSTPIVYVPKLNADTENPVYMIDWKWMAIGVMAGWENNLGKPYMVPGKHLVRRVDLDCTLQCVCTDLRRQAVFYNP